MTGFDAPSVSTIYLDRPMRNHTLMQTIARANRVFPDKDNGLIVDYIGVFRDLEKALAIYGAANADADVDSPIQDKSRAGRRPGRRRRRSGRVLRALRRRSRRAAPGVGVRLHRPAGRRGRGAAGRRGGARPSSWPPPVRRGSCSRRCCPTRRRPSTRRRWRSSGYWPNGSSTSSRPARADLDAVTDAVDALLDRSVGAEEYVIRAAAEGIEPDPLIDLSQIDFDALSAAVRRAQAGRDRPPGRAAEASERWRGARATRPGSTWSSASRS